MTHLSFRDEPESLHEKMDLQQLQNQCKYEVNTTFDQICLYLPRGKFHRWIIFAREAKMVNTAFTQSLQSKANEKKNCTLNLHHIYFCRKPV